MAANGEWHCEKRASSKIESFARDSENVTETGCLSIIVLGASGDLAKKKTFPALFNLYQQGFLQLNDVHIFGYSRTKLHDDELRERIQGYLPVENKVSSNVSDFLQLIKYVSGAYDSQEGFQELDNAISEHETSKKSREGSSRRLFYLALPPSVYPQVCKMIKTFCTNKCTLFPLKYGDGLSSAEHQRTFKIIHSFFLDLVFAAGLSGWTRVVLEKPFGKDLASAEEMSAQIGELFDEPQIYRIDHYLGKELVQNLLVLRFANRFFLPLWNRDNISNVQIVFREDFGTEGRGGYFDQYGIIRDIIQNHLLQIFCLVAMEKPVSNKPEHIRDEKVKVLQSVNPIRDEDVVLGQYRGYKDDPNGVPFILKAGKALNSLLVLDLDRELMKWLISVGSKQGRNEFVIRLQPSEAMYMKLTVKQPGLEMTATQSELDLSYRQRYQGVVIPEAYKRLILDTIQGDQQHFVRRDELKAAWEIFTPLLHRIDEGELQPLEYEPGSRGPVEADKLLEKAGYVQTHGYIWIPPTL
ncbi:hypothetical protein SASPL_118307 [Salvia splendens]|uniref:glucose-6-phosphate dehydrogenase (NADP(+)) n=1 Tax=Salvia splendens TaxID=180675 RepID=A0A8X8XXG7_SALSN|nr:hypothetical protein SASPL_118307 [Salvia splendens]